MKRILQSILIAATLAAPSVRAQPALSLTASAPIIKSGGSLTLTVSVPAITGMTSVQFGLTLPTATAGMFTPNPALTNKSIQCGYQVPVAACILSGVNTATIPAGTLATIPITLPAGSGATAFTVTAYALGADKNGGAIPLTSASLLIPVQSPYDLNGDGIVNSADTVIELGAALQAFTAQLVAAMTNNTTAPAACPQDLNGDGVCNVQDVQLIRNQYP